MILDDAVRRVGERDRNTLARANALIATWDGKASQRRRTLEPTTMGEAATAAEARVYAECSRQLLDALAGPRGEAAQ